MNYLYLKGATEMIDIDLRLQQLVKQAQQHPPLSKQRQIALNKLINEIQQSNRLCQPQKNTWNPQIYEDIYNEALSKTLLEICQHIDEYREEYAVLAWVNNRLKQRFIDAVRQYYQQKKVKEKINYIPPENPTPLDILTEESQMLKQFLETDPENHFKTTFIKGNPAASFQTIAIAKFIEDKTWEEISIHLGISVPTLASFINRNLHNLLPYFRKYLQ
ncbi:MAG: sigma-70 family RNA polymerase sigma factor [Phormidium sp.]